MNDLPAWTIPAAAGVLGAFAVILIALRMRNAPRSGDSTPRRVQQFDLACTVCQQTLSIAVQDMRRLEGSEIALAVRVIPKLVGRPLADYVCPHCEADHCFTMDQGKPEWVGANLYSPQSKVSICQECQKVLKRPPWPERQYQGHPQDAPNPHPDYGLVCARCGARCCVSCVQSATRNRTKDGSFLCPRCRRQPVDAFFYP